MDHLAVSHSTKFSNQPCALTFLLVVPIPSCHFSHSRTQCGERTFGFKRRSNRLEHPHRNSPSVQPLDQSLHRFRSLSADFQKDMSRGVTSMLHGNLHDVTMPVGATLIAAGLAVLALLFVVLRRGHALVSPRLPTRT